MNKKTKTKKKPTLKTDPSYNARDRVLVTYQSKWFDIVDVPGIILRANRNSGHPFKIKLQETDGKPINLGHNDDGGEPGSGPFMYCADDNLKLVEKYVPKRLDGKIKDVWRVGESFTPKIDFCIDQDDEDDRTGVNSDMVDKCTGQSMIIAAVINRCGVNWLLDGTENYMWLAPWIDPIDE